MNDETYKINRRSRLQGIKQLNAERASGQSQGIPLRHHLRNHILVDHLRLLHHLDGIQVVGVGFLVAQEHLPEGAPADWLHNAEVLDFRCLEKQILIG